ncbi:FAD-dependent oxidoreductase [Salinicoccus cyprini]|uniref:FAD-dependent oxidoreductase n=1 Tax=Salinicoccus cyprini TaxID=2493691 RepID=A0A558AZU5_9STAP|nr:FAD-dependent oxidoreductase [Salinicoccus cyprini]TVT29792.1 FAD-dependent oxidoreductase [Salinicoccus cyprini]
MSEFKHDNISIWSDTAELPSYPKLENDIETEVLVVGAGITGLMNAYQLAMKGYKVTVIDTDYILGGTTANTTARIMAQQGMLYSQLIKQKDKETARLYYDSQMEAIAEMEAIGRKHNIDGDFRRVDGVMYVEEDASVSELEKEAEAYKELGIDGTLLKKELDLPFETAAELIMRNQAEFHPLKYLKGILEVLAEKDVSIYEHTRGKSLDGDTLATNDGNSIHFRHLIIATHFPFLDYQGFYFNSFKINRSYGLVVTTSTPPPENVSLGGQDGPSLTTRHIMGADNELPTLLFGGMGHMSYMEKDMVDQLEKLRLYADQKTTNHERLYAYRAQDLMTVDSMPYIGYFDTDRDNVFVAAGFNKYGMTNGVLSSMIISDLIEGKDNRYHEMLSPHRSKGLLHQLKDQGTTPLESMGVEAKNMLKSYPSMDEVDLSAGEGAVVRDGMMKKGLYKDEDSNEYYVVDNRCTHMGCSLSWNQSDRTWDCPCHGSRFNFKGNVIEGPATTDLDVEVKRTND